MTIPISVPNLLKSPSTIEERLAFAEINVKSFDEMKPLMLQFGALNLSGIGGLPLTESEIESMDFDELSRVIKEHRRRK